MNTLATAKIGDHNLVEPVFNETSYMKAVSYFQEKIINDLKSSDNRYEFEYANECKCLFDDTQITGKDVFAHIAENEELTSAFAIATRLQDPSERCAAQNEVIDKAIEDIVTYYASEEAAAMPEQQQAA